MFCIKCGNELKDGEVFCIKCGEKIDDTNMLQEKTKKEKLVVEETSAIKGLGIKNTENASDSISKSKSNKCKFCGNAMLENEKFCIHCGRTAQGEMAKKESKKRCDTGSLKVELQNMFNSNGILKIISKFALVFAFYYPINLIINNLKLAPDLIDVLGNIDIIMFYGYYIALISLYANKKYIPLMLAILLRLTNSIIHLCASGFDIISIERIGVILILLFYLFKELKETEEYKKFENKYQEIKGGLEAEIKVKICPNCSEKISESSAFCPKCGNKM